MSLNKTLCPLLSAGSSESIDLTDDLQLPSNHNRSFTRVLLGGYNIYDMLYL